MTTHLSSLTDAELLSEFRVKRDPLVTTPMEEELAARLEDSLGFSHEAESLRKKCTELVEENYDLSNKVMALEDRLADIRNVLDQTN